MADTATQSALRDPNGKPIIQATLHHTSNYTTRVDEMLAWYRNVVGMEITSSPEALPGHFVSNDEAHHRMSFFHLPNMNPDVVRDAAGINHIAFDYESLDDLLETWERLTALDILPHTTVNHGPSWSFYYWDPDGNNVELQTDAFGDRERSMTYFKENPAFQRNPMGMQVNPALLIEARRRGMSIDEVHERSMNGDFGPEATPSWDGWDQLDE